MDFGKLAPWNWFRHEDEEKETEKDKIVPVLHATTRTEVPRVWQDIHTEFDRVFDLMRRNISPAFKDDEFFNMNLLAPSLDVASDGKEYSVKVELPGIEADDISIEYSGNTLTIKGEKRQEVEEKEKDYYHVERQYGSFQRLLNIPDDGDAENITSNFKNGVLSVTIPRKALPHKESKKIKVETEA